MKSTRLKGPKGYRELEEQLPPAVLDWYRRFYEAERVRLVSHRASRCLLPFLVFQNGRELAIRDVSHQLLTDYLLTVDARVKSRSSRRHYRGALRRWLRFLYREQVLLLAWHEEVDLNCRGSKRKVQPLTYGQMKKIFQVPDLQTQSGLLFRAVLELFYGCALRKGELYALNLGDVDLQERVVYVRCSKNGTGRSLPLVAPAHHFLLRYLLEVRPAWCREHSDDAFFLDSDGKRFLPWNLILQIRAGEDQLGFRFTLHQLRHSCATHLLRAGLNVAYIQIFLGHRQLNSTQVYTHLTPLELQEVHTRCHPANH